MVKALSVSNIKGDLIFLTLAGLAFVVMGIALGVVWLFVKAREMIAGHRKGK